MQGISDIKTRQGNLSHVSEKNPLMEGEPFADFMRPRVICLPGCQPEKGRGSVPFSRHVPRKSLIGQPTSIGEGKCSLVAILAGGNVRQLVGKGRGGAVAPISTLESGHGAGEMFASYHPRRGNRSPRARQGLIPRGESFADSARGQGSCSRIEGELFSEFRRGRGKRSQIASADKRLRGNVRLEPLFFGGTVPK